MKPEATDSAIAQMAASALLGFLLSSVVLSHLFQMLGNECVLKIPRNIISKSTKCKAVQEMKKYKEIIGLQHPMNLFILLC